MGEYVGKFDLQENEWLQRFVQSVRKVGYGVWEKYFFASKKSTQFNESFNFHLKNYLKFDLNLVQFFLHFESAVEC